MSKKGPNSTFSVVVGENTRPAETPPKERPGVGRAFLGVHFECCNLYARIYKNRDGSAYEGRCPQCCAPVRVGIGKGGSSKRFFRVG